MRITTKQAKNNQKTLFEYVQQSIGRYRRELNELRAAREIRYDVDYPLTYAMVEVYTDALLDTHLRAVIENRILRIVNMPFEIKAADGMPDDELTKLIQEPWFTDTIRALMESIFHGYSLIHLNQVENNRIKEICLIPREHVVPEKGWILYNVTDTDKGFPYNEFPNELLYAQMYDSIGLLENACPMTILKRHSWASWDESEQKFSLPLMIAKVASGNKIKRKEVADWMAELGRNASGVFDEGTEIEIKDGNKPDAFQIFLQKIKEVDSQISKLINGQTMTVDNGSSRSQSEVHQNTQDEITRADKREVIFWLNNVLKPAMTNIGYPISDENLFSVQEIVNPNDKIKIDTQLLNAGYKMTPEYIERIYGVELDQNAEIDTTKKKS